jgi:hypothetical protein
MMTQSARETDSAITCAVRLHSHSSSSLASDVVADKHAFANRVVM